MGLLPKLRNVTEAFFQKDSHSLVKKENSYSENIETDPRLSERCVVREVRHLSFFKR